MKKIVSFLLLLTMLGQNIVFAQSKNQLNLPTQQSDEYIANIEIVKEPIQLKSELSKKYLGYSYTITNLEKDPILIENIGYAVDPKSALYSTKTNRQKERFPRVFLLPISKCGEIATTGIMLVSAVIFPPLAFACFMGLTDNPKPKSENGFHSYVILPVRSTLLAPYYCINDPKENRKVVTESNQFNNNFRNITIKPNEKIQLAILIETYRYKKNYTKEICDGIIIKIKNIKTGQRCSIDK